MSSARGDATSTRSSALTPLHVAVTIAVPAATAVASPASGSIRSTAGASVVHSTARGGSRVPCSPRITATSVKLSPASSPAGAGMIEMPPTGRPVAVPGCEARVRGAGLVGGASSVAAPPLATTCAISSTRCGSSSASGAAPRAAIASASLGHRSAGSLASIRRMAASTSARTVLAGVADRRRRALHVRLHHRESRARERRRAGHQLVGHRAQRVLVRSLGHLRPAALLRAHVGGRPHQCAGQRVTGPRGRLGDAEVGHDGVAVDVDQDVGRLDVAVDHLAAVGVLQGRADLVEDRADCGKGQPARGLDHLLQRAPGHVAHDEVVQPFRLPHRVHRHDVRMVQMGDGDRLVAEPLDHAFAQQQPGRHHLDGDLAVQGDLVRQEDRRHAAPAQLPADLELPQGGAAESLHDVGHRRGGVGGTGEEVEQDGGFGGCPAVGTGEVGGQARPAARGARERLGAALGTVAIAGLQIAAAVRTRESRSHHSAGVEPNFPASILQAGGPPRNVSKITFRSLLRLT